MDFLNPLHTPEFVTRQIANSGRFDVKRYTGRTTAACLRALASAIENPFKPQSIEGHAGERPGYDTAKDRQRQALALANKMGLREFYAIDRDCRIQFGKP